MRKTIAILLAAALALTAIACAAENKLVDTWGDGYQSFTFKKDGSGLFTENGTDYPMTYTVDGDVLTVRYRDGDEETCSFRIDGDRLILKTQYETVEFTKE